MLASGIAAVSSELRSLFLEGLTPIERKTILAAATKRQFFANAVITSQGHPANHLFLLTRGLTRYFIITEEGRKLLLKWLGPGDLFGGRTVLLNTSTYLCSTETVTHSSVLIWDRPTIRGLMARYPRLFENALLTASDYVDWQLASNIRLACHTARQRVAHVLLTLARTIGQEVSGGIALRISNEDLANAANVSPFTASRLVSEWHRKRALVKRRGNVLLVSPDQISRV